MAQAQTAGGGGGGGGEGGGGGGAVGRPTTQRRVSNNAFLRSWTWKREGRPDRDRFHKPYLYVFDNNDDDDDNRSNKQLTIQQRPFSVEGFASTVWDSSIVLAKYAERWPQHFKGERCIELGAGCGLLGLVLARLGARVTITDLACNLPLIAENAAGNNIVEGGDGDNNLRIEPLAWGDKRAAARLSPPFDVVVATDVMYIREAVPALLMTLELLSGRGTQIYLAYGRNRWAEDLFLRGCAGRFEVGEVPQESLHAVYNCVDVSVMNLPTQRAACQSPRKT